MGGFIGACMQGRMQLFGPCVHPKNKFLMLQMTPSASGIMCEDVVESLTPIQTPLPGTDVGISNIPTGPSDYAPSPISDVRKRMVMNGADSKTDHTSPYMPPPSPWMNQRPLGVDVNVAYVENREDPDRGAQPQLLTKVVGFTLKLLMLVLILLGK